MHTAETPDKTLLRVSESGANAERSMTPVPTSRNHVQVFGCLLLIWAQA